MAFATGSLQGFSFSLLPSLATYLTASYGLSAQMYGALFIPQTVFAVIGAFGAPLIAERHGAMTTLRIGIIANILALAALIASTGLHGFRYRLLLVDTAALGLGFGLCNSSANALAEVSAENPDRAVTVLNIVTGLSTSLSPAIIGALGLIALHAIPSWTIWPLLLALFFICAFAVSGNQPKTTVPTTSANAPATPILLWIFALGAVLYGTCEGSFSSWATALAQEHGASPTAADLALTGFWLSLTAFRIFAVVQPKLVPLRKSIPVSALSAAVVFAILPTLQGSIAIVGGYILGGISCGILYPYLIANALDAIQGLNNRVTGYLTGGLMIGEGVGSFAIGAARPSIGLDGAYHLLVVVAVALAIIAMLALSRSPDKTVISTS